MRNFNASKFDSSIDVWHGGRKGKTEQNKTCYNLKFKKNIF